MAFVFNRFEVARALHNKEEKGRVRCLSPYHWLDLKNNQINSKLSATFISSPYPPPVLLLSSPFISFPSPSASTSLLTTTEPSYPHSLINAQPASWQRSFFIACHSRSPTYIILVVPFDMLDILAEIPFHSVSL